MTVNKNSIKIQSIIDFNHEIAQNIRDTYRIKQ